ncbi:MAG TPA: efflux RND transporter periplasmic adaptor subunit [Chloroflexota bacterium]|jgi:HlyD family secretion protein
MSTALAPGGPSTQPGPDAPAPARPAAPPGARRSHRRALAPIALLLVAALVAAWQLWPAPPAGALTASGTVEADEVTVAAESPGRLVELLVDEGSPVRSGQRLGQLDDGIVQVQLKQAGPAERQLLEVQLERLTLRSPLNGIVLKRLARQGEVVGGGAPVLTVARLDELTLTVYVPEADLGRVAVGQSVEVRADAFAGRAFAGQVQTIASRAEFTPRNVQTGRDRRKLVFAVKVRLPNGGGELKPGLPVDVTFVG